MSKIRLKRSHLEEILAHCIEEFPKEACGIVSGRGNAYIDGVAEKVYRTVNVSETPYKLYTSDPEQQGRIFDEIDRENLEMLAIYHSHPEDSASPSECDLEDAKYQKSFYLIVSLANPKEPVIKAYTIIDGKIQEAELEITD